MKQNPFSLYDFLGYFIPGSFLIYIIVIINFLKTSCGEITLNKTFEALPNLNLVSIVLMLIVSYSLGHILSFISSITIEKYSEWKYGYPSRYLLNQKSSGFFSHFNSFKGVFWGIIMIIILLPIMIFDFILGRFFGFKDFYVKPLDETLRKIIILKVNKMATVLGLTKENGIKNGDFNTSDFFRIVQHYTYDNSNYHQSKFSNYVALYGFLRTMALIMNILFWYLIFHFSIINKWNWEIFILIFSVSTFAYIFFMAFMKFYRRYTLEGFMVLTADKEIK